VFHSQSLPQSIIHSVHNVFLYKYWNWRSEFLEYVILRYPWKQLQTRVGTNKSLCHWRHENSYCVVIWLYSNYLMLCLLLAVYREGVGRQLPGVSRRSTLITSCYACSEVWPYHAFVRLCFLMNILLVNVFLCFTDTHFLNPVSKFGKTVLFEMHEQLTYKREFAPNALVRHVCSIGYGANSIVCTP